MHGVHNKTLSTARCTRIVCMGASSAVNFEGRQMHQKDKSAFLTAEEGHAVVGKDKISRRSFYNALERKQIPSTRIGRRILIPRRAFLDWLKQQGALASRGD